MVAAMKRNTSLTLDAAALDEARKYGVNVSAVADAALSKAVADARRQQWLKENAAAFEAQSKWHKENGHPLADVMVGFAGDTWKS